VFGRAYGERLSEAQIVLEARQVLALDAGLRKNCRVILSVFTCLLMACHYRPHSATQTLLLGSSLAARICIHQLYFWSLHSKKKAFILISDHTNYVYELVMLFFFFLATPEAYGNSRARD